jgi:hypothetical protein
LGSVFVFQSGEELTSVLAGLTITDGYTSYGGGIYCNESSPTIINNIISENSADFGGGGGMCNLLESNPTVTNCTFSGNSAFYYGGGMTNEYSNPIVTNCILWGDIGHEIYNDSSEPIVTYSDVQSGYTGEGNINADPQFMTYKGYDYLLGNGSPCIDTGDPTIEDGVSDWKPAWPDWYPNSSRSDMGAYGGPGNVGWLP